MASPTPDPIPAERWAELVAEYRRERNLWRASPSLGQVRARLRRIAELSAALAVELDATDPWTRVAVDPGGCLAAPAVAEALDGDLAWTLERLCREAGRAEVELGRRTAGWTGRRASTVQHLDGPPPRWRAVAALEAAAPGCSAMALQRCAYELFLEAGDDAPEVGLADVVKSVRAARGSTGSSRLG